MARTRPAAPLPRPALVAATRQRHRRETRRRDGPSVAADAGPRGPRPSQPAGPRSGGEKPRRRWIGGPGPRHRGGSGGGGGPMTAGRRPAVVPPPSRHVEAFLEMLAAEARSGAQYPGGLRSRPGRFRRLYKGPRTGPRKCRRRRHPRLSGPPVGRRHGARHDARRLSALSQFFRFLFDERAARRRSLGHHRPTAPRPVVAQVPGRGRGGCPVDGGATRPGAEGARLGGAARSALRDRAQGVGTGRPAVGGV